MTDLSRQARELLGRFPLIDGHNDLPWTLRGRAGGDVNLAAPVDGTHTDLPRLAAGQVGAQFWSVYVPSSLAGDGAIAAVLEQIDLTRRMIACYPEALGLALTADDVERIFASGRVASLLGVAHVGLGGDFDGTEDVTAGLEDVSTYPALFAELLRRGWTEADCAALAGGNVLRALRAAETYAAGTV